jgi:hypothetical protein
MLWDIDVLEDGRDIESTRTCTDSRTRAAPLTLSQRNRDTYHVMTSSTFGWSILRLVDDNVPPTSLQPEMYRLLWAVSGNSNAALASSLVAKTKSGLWSDYQKAANVRSLSTAPEDWQYYLQFNYVALDPLFLSRMQKQRPALAEALKQYVAGGGSVLLIGGAQPSAEGRLDAKWLVDQWLSGAAVPKTDRSQPVQPGDWRTVNPQVEDWWYRDPSRSSGTATQAMQPFAPPPTQMTTTTSSGGAPAAVSIPAPPIPQPPNDPRSTATLAATSPVNPQSTASPIASASPSADASLSAAAAETLPLSLGGCARDLLTASETYAMAQYGAPAWLLDDWVETLWGAGDPVGMAAGGGVTTAGPLFAVEEALVPLRASLQSAVAELQSRDAIGCSWRTYGLGKAGVVESDLDAQPAEVLRALTYELSDSASVRIDAAHESSWSWRNLISSVGKPPVWTFCAFVLLFGLLLGPGLLIFTGWMGRRSLLIFLVPCVSLAATVLIATYEILHEGFDTHIRITSLQTIDQPTGHGFAWSRQTYFSGWPPGNGLVFPRNVYFRSVVPNANFRGRVDGPRETVDNRIDVAAGESRWTGWLNAREQKQLLIGHPASPIVPLKATQVDARHVTLKNLTAERLPFAAVRDGAEAYYLATDLAPGAEMTCVAQTAYDVGVELVRVRAKHIPVAPLEMQGSSGWGWVRYYVSFDVSTSEMLDSAWHKYLSEELELPRYGFVTLRDTSEAIYVPLEGKVTESKHLIVGRLEW